MPSSPTFRDYERKAQRFFYRGVSLLPQDALGPGKVAQAQNIRSRVEGEITVRDGLKQITSNTLDGPANTLMRLNDPAQLAGGAAALRFFGTDQGTLYAAAPTGGADAYAEVDDGYSGDPLSGVTAMPVRSPQPWLYISDRDRTRKINADEDVRSIGLPPPAGAPSARLAEVKSTFLQSIDSGTWVPFGGTAGAVSTGPTGRVNAVVNAAIYDEGATGMCSIALDSFRGVTEGATIAVGGSAETVIVQQVIPSISPTTIQAILYDAGASGLCTIQPEGSFALGQTEIAFPDDIRRRYYALSSGDEPHVTITRTIDYPVNGLIMIDGIELVRIQSVAIGPDGVMSFRAFTAGTYAAGQTLTGATCFRAYTQTTVSGGDPAVSPSATNLITPVDEETPAFAGIQTPISPERDWSQVGDRAMQPDDIIALGIRVSQLAYVQFVRLMLATNDSSIAAGEEFSQNYFQYEWRANDLIEALQAALASASAEGVSSMLDAQTGAVTSGQVESFYQDGFGTEPLGGNRTAASRGGDGLTRQRGVSREGFAAAQGRARGEASRLDGSDRIAVPRTDGFVTAGTAPSRQLSLGNEQWITLQCRVRDLLRVGTDPARTISNLNAAAIVTQIVGTADPITVTYADPYLTGGYGPDCGLTRAPYVWRYRYRSTITGERSNPSPSMRGGLPARRQRVTLNAAGCVEPQCDVIDWFRFGGNLSRWSYVRSVANDTGGGTVTCNDDMADRQIEGSETLDVDLFQPWPLADLPRSGTCRVVGTSVERISGDSFNTAWAPDTIILVNGRATALYGSPSSTDRLQVIDNCDAGDPVEWSIPSPTIMAQPLPCLWGGFVDEVWFHFACGDAVDPGTVRWTRGNDPDASSDANNLAVTSASEPLQHGFIWDGVSYVFSTEGLYRLPRAFSGPSAFRAEKTDCTRGLWNKWAFCIGDAGVYFVAQDGIFVTTGGKEVSIVDPDLRRLFPRDGANPTDIGGLDCIEGIDFLGPMKLTKVDQMIYFDYRTTGGNFRTLVCEPLYDHRWTPDVYTISGARSRLEEPGPFVHTNVIGCDNGIGYQFDADQIDDAGDVGIPWFISTSWANADDPRALKQWGDAVVDVDTAASCDGLRVEPVLDNGVVGLTPTIIGVLIDGRETYTIELPTGGVLSRNFGLIISGIIQSLDVGRPRLFLWEPSWLWKQTPIGRRTTDWENLGYIGAKFVQGVVLRANTFNQVKQLSVQYDGGQQAFLLPVHHNGEQQIAYPRTDLGWTPFTAELVRLVGADDLEWTLLDWRWVWEPAPELATQWESQSTTFDFPGYGAISNGVLAYQSAVDTTLRIYHDNSYVDYTIPSSGSLYRRFFLQCRAAKGLSYRFRWTGSQPFRVYQRDTSLRVTAWGSGGGYTIVAPFGGPSRVVGAEV
jgi:hypothetical protein